MSLSNMPKVDSEIPCALFDFRANGDVPKEKIVEFCRKYGKHYTFQKEEGEDRAEGAEHGYIHWQGHISLKAKTRRSTAIRTFQSDPIGFVPNYFFPTSRGTIQGGTVAFYQQKMETRIESPYTDQDKEELYIPRQIRGLVLRPFQRDIVESRSVFDDRSIDFIYDPKGCIGKSKLRTYVLCHRLGYFVPPENDATKLVATAMNFFQDANDHEPGLVIIDMPRAMNKSLLNGLFSAIETIKDGVAWDQRYHGRIWTYDSPRIWVFSNVPPPVHMLSNDRWRCHSVDDEYKFVPRTTKWCIDDYAARTSDSSPSGGV